MMIPFGHNSQNVDAGILGMLGQTLRALCSKREVNGMIIMMIITIMDPIKKSTNDRKP